MASIRLRRGAVMALTLIVAVTTALVALAGPKPAYAAQLTQISDFGNNPGNLGMYLYVPDNVTANPAVVVGNHWCGGSATRLLPRQEFDEQANQLGFIVIYPSVTRASKCFDVASQASLTGTGGDSVSIKSMVDYVLANYGADPNRIFAAGVSSGAMMTNVLLGVYPEVFKAGAAFAGVPFTCFATGNGSEWNSECSEGRIDRTPQQWGDAVRSANPGYTGPWPRMQLWHGVNDDVLRYPNFQEQIEQWTNVNGTDQVAELHRYAAGELDSHPLRRPRRPGPGRSDQHGRPGAQHPAPDHRNPPLLRPDRVAGRLQRWNLNANGTITNAYNGLCPDTDNAASTTPLIRNGGNNQRWSLG